MPKTLSTYLLAASLAAAPAAWADNYASPAGMNAGAYGAGAGAAGAQKPESYGQAISTKLGVGVANLFLAPLEIHKNIVNTTNETGRVAAGVTLGVLKGGLHMAGRLIAGFVDMVSFPLPTEPLTTPQYTWQDYNVETRYGPLLKMKNTQ